MLLKHIGISVNDEREIELFYVRFLGFKRMYNFTIDQETIQAVFGLNREVRVVVLNREDISLEVFIHEQAMEQGFHHICIAVKNPSETTNRAQESGYEVKRIPRNGKTVFFISDRSNNLFELKEI